MKQLQRVIVGLLSLAGLSAQDEGEPKFKFELTDGRVMIRTVDGLEPKLGPIEICDPLGSAPSRVGPLMLLYAFAGGDTDLVSLANADRFFERLETADAEILQYIMRPAEADDARWIGLRRILAIRAAQDRGLKPALGVLGRVLDEDGVDPFTRRAALEAQAALKGQIQPPTKAPELAPLTDVLRELPAKTNMVVVVDQWRSPSLRPASGWLRSVSMLTNLRFMFVDADTLEWQFEQAASQEALGLLGYAYANALGNARVHRAIFAGQFDDAQRQGGAPEFVFSFEGTFDPDAMRPAFVAADLVEDGQGSFVIEEGEVHVTVRPGRILLRAKAPGDLVDAAGAKAWAERVSSGAPIRGAREGSVFFPDPNDELPNDKTPTRFSMTLPRRVGESLIIQAEFESEQFAAAVAGLAKGLPRLVEVQANDMEALDPVVEMLEELDVGAMGKSVTLELPWTGIDVEAVIEGVTKR